MHNPSSQQFEKFYEEHLAESAQEFQVERDSAKKRIMFRVAVLFIGFTVAVAALSYLQGAADLNQDALTIGVGAIGLIAILSGIYLYKSTRKAISSDTRYNQIIGKILDFVFPDVQYNPQEFVYPQESRLQPFFALVSGENQIQYDYRGGHRFVVNNELISSEIQVKLAGPNSDITGPDITSSNSIKNSRIVKNKANSRWYQLTQIKTQRSFEAIWAFTAVNNDQTNLFTSGRGKNIVKTGDEDFDRAVISFTDRESSKIELTESFKSILTKVFTNPDVLLILCRDQTISIIEDNFGSDAFDPSVLKTQANYHHFAKIFDRLIQLSQTSELLRSIR